MTIEEAKENIRESVRNAFASCDTITTDTLVAIGEGLDKQLVGACHIKHDQNLPNTVAIFLNTMACEDGKQGGFVIIEAQLIEDGSCRFIKSI